MWAVGSCESACELKESFHLREKEGDLDPTLREIFSPQFPSQHNPRMHIYFTCPCSIYNLYIRNILQFINGLWILGKVLRSFCHYQCTLTQRSSKDSQLWCHCSDLNHRVTSGSLLGQPAAYNSFKDKYLQRWLINSLSQNCVMHLTHFTLSFFNFFFNLCLPTLWSACYRQVLLHS